MHQSVDRTSNKKAKILLKILNNNRFFVAGVGIVSVSCRDLSLYVPVLLLPP